MIWGLGIGGWGLVQSLSYLVSVISYQLSVIRCRVLVPESQVTDLLHILNLFADFFEFGLHTNNSIGQFCIIRF